MFFWQALLNGFRAALFAVSHVYGGSLGFAVITVTLTGRLALLRVNARIRRRASRALAGWMQLPVGLAMFRVVRDAVAPGGRFLWIASLARPDGILTAVVIVGSMLVAFLSPTTGVVTSGVTPQRFTLIIALITTALVMTQMSSGVGLYWMATNAAGVANNFISRRRRS